MCTKNCYPKHLFLCESDFISLKVGETSLTANPAVVKDYKMQKVIELVTRLCFSGYHKRTLTTS